jgi:hypothetical protein
MTPEIFIDSPTSDRTCVGQRLILEYLMQGFNLFLQYIQQAPKVSGLPREPYRKTLCSQCEKVLKFSFDLNDYFCVCSLKFQEQF